VVTNWCRDQDSVPPGGVIFVGVVKSCGSLASSYAHVCSEHHWKYCSRPDLFGCVYDGTWLFLVLMIVLLKAVVGDVRNVLVLSGV